MPAGLPVWLTRQEKSPEESRLREIPSGLTYIIIWNILCYLPTWLQPADGDPYLERPDIRQVRGGPVFYKLVYLVRSEYAKNAFTYATGYRQARTVKIAF